MATDRAALLAQALQRFRLTADAEHDQRSREVEDLRFVDWDEQWPTDVQAARAGQAANGSGMPSVPARPCLTINKLRQPVQQVVNQARSSRLMLQFSPKGNGASKATAELFEDLARAIQVDSRAHLARNWAFERAAKCGRGVYRIVTQPVERAARDGEWTPEDFDLEIAYKRILNQASVYLDPFATEPDWSDGEWAFITEDVPVERYKRQFPDSDMAGMDDDELSAVGDDAPGWINTAEDGGKTIRIAEYFYIQHARKRVVALADGTIVPGDQVPDGAVIQSTREVDERQVKWCKLNAVEILDAQDWDGAYIPIIPVIGDESNINGERRWQGIVRPARDAQKSYNYMRSSQIEGIGLAPKAPFVGYNETIEPYRQWWDQANVRNLPFLPVFAARDSAGAVLPPPKRESVEPAIKAITMAAHEANDDIHATTGIPPVALGQLDPHERSGKAIQALQAQAEVGSSAYLDNLANMSMQYEGKILKDLIPRVYDRPGRIVAAIGADEQRTLVMLNTLFSRDAEGNPVPTRGPDGQPLQQPSNKPGFEYYDLKGGAYAVAVKVGKSYTTRLEQQGDMLGDIAKAAPQLLPAFADVWIEDMDLPGGQKIADRVRKVTGMGDDEGQPDPQQLQQQLQQAGQMMQLLTKELDAKTKLLETEAHKLQADLQKASMDNATKLEIAKINAQAGLAEAEIKAQIADMGHQIQVLEAMLGNAHAAAEQGREHAHARQMAEHEAEQALTQQAAQMGHEQSMAEQQAQQQGAEA